MLQQYIRRNLPVFVIGAVTVGIFLLVIVLSNTSDNSQSLLPQLRRVSEDEISTEADTENTSDLNQTPTVGTVPNNEVVIETEDGLIITPNPETQAEIQAGLDSAYMDAADVKQNYPVLEIIYTPDIGFTPRRATGYQYQTVRFVNDSNTGIVIGQTGLKYTFWETDKSLTPGGFIEFELEKDGLWTFAEKTNSKYGSISVQRAVNN